MKRDEKGEKTVTDSSYLEMFRNLTSICEREDDMNKHV